MISRIRYIIARERLIWTNWKARKTLPTWQESVNQLQSVFN